MFKSHPTALVDPRAELGEDVEIGPYSIINEGVIIGDGTKIISHVVIESGTQIGKNCQIFSGCILGNPPQHLKYAGEKTLLVIGNNNIIREGVTMHRGTPFDKGITQIGDNNYLMAYVHIAHDCTLGDYNIMANLATLAGHVTLEDHVQISGLVSVHQHVRFGRYSIVGGSTKVVKDIPPYMLADGNPAEVCGVNLVGLKRNNFPEDTKSALRKAYRLIYRSNLNVSQAIAKIEEELIQFLEIQHLIDFIRNSKRGITR
jgi:UDP-N-acetylglucosamine acyltransferase